MFVFVKLYVRILLYDSAFAHAVGFHVYSVISRLAIIIMYITKQMWGAVVLSVIISFGAFLITFAAVAVGMALEGIGDKISEILAS